MWVGIGYGDASEGREAVIYWRHAIFNPVCTNSKADIFDHPVSFNINEVTQVDTPEEALSASLNKYGGVNLGYMA